jgi:hypothetical protein
LGPVLGDGAAGVGLATAVGLAFGSIEGLGWSAAFVSAEVAAGDRAEGGCPVVAPRPSEFATIAATTSTPVIATTTLAVIGIARLCRGGEAGFSTGSAGLGPGAGRAG